MSSVETQEIKMSKTIFHFNPEEQKGVAAVTLY